jgi:hypothetical protein
MANYTVSTNDYANGGVMVEILLAGADTTLPNYGNVQRFRAASGHSLYAWSLVSGQNGIQSSQDAAIKAAARAIWRNR